MHLKSIHDNIGMLFKTDYYVLVYYTAISTTRVWRFYTVQTPALSSCTWHFVTCVIFLECSEGFKGIYTTVKKISIHI